MKISQFFYIQFFEFLNKILKLHLWANLKEFIVATSLSNFCRFFKFVIHHHSLPVSVLKICAFKMFYGEKSSSEIFFRILRISQIFLLKKNLKTSEFFLIFLSKKFWNYYIIIFEFVNKILKFHLWANLKESIVATSLFNFFRFFKICNP